MADHRESSHRARQDGVTPRSSWWPSLRATSRTARSRDGPSTARRRRQPRRLAWSCSSPPWSTEVRAANHGGCCTRTAVASEVGRHLVPLRGPGRRRDAHVGSCPSRRKPVRPPVRSDILRIPADPREQRPARGAAPTARAAGGGRPRWTADRFSARGAHRHVTGSAHSPPESPYAADPPDSRRRSWVATSSVPGRRTASPSTLLSDLCVGHRAVGYFAPRRGAITPVSVSPRVLVSCGSRHV